MGARLRKQALFARVVQLKLRYSDFTTLTRQAPLKPASHHDEDLIQGALALFEKLDPDEEVRLIGVGTSGLTAHPERDADEDQPLLPGLDTPDDSGEEDRKRRLDEAVDELRGKYGRGSLRRGSGG